MEKLISPQQYAKVQLAPPTKTRANGGASADPELA